MPDLYSGINAASGVKTAATVTAQNKKSDTLGQEQFLKLFVAQLQNQDPMNPQDATEISSQLAQYSQLEQLTNINRSMKTLIEAYQNTAKISSLGTIGKDVAYASSDIIYDGEPATIGYRLQSPASRISITIRKENAVVATLNGEKLAKGDHYLTWDGTNDNGDPLPQGDYTFSAQALDSEGKATQLTTLVRNEVTGIDLTGQNGGTIKTRGKDIDFNSILGVFNRT